MTASLTELANRYNSDKGNEYKCAHHYTKYYEQLFDRFKGKAVSLLEIGLNRDDTSDVPSLRMYRDYLGEKAKITGFDIRPGFELFEDDGFDIIIGDQSNPFDLAACRTEKRTVIIDDGSHASSHQQITLRELWKAVKPGGYYIIEDLHWQPFQEMCPKTVELARQWEKGNAVGSEHLPEAAVRTILDEADSLALLPSHSRLHDPRLTAQALLVIKKK